MGSSVSRALFAELIVADFCRQKLSFVPWVAGDIPFTTLKRRLLCCPTPPSDEEDDKEDSEESARKQGVRRVQELTDTIPLSKEDTEALQALCLQVCAGQ